MNVAVVLMAYGSPDRLEDVPAYYADIRGGRPIKPEHLEDLVARYRRLGIEDSNPLNEITEATRAALEAELGIPVFTGMRHWQPRIADAVEQALAGGADVIVGLVLAPHYSSMSIERYRAQLVDAVGGRAEIRFVERWGDEPGFVDLIADRVRGTDAHVVFTAHSLPARILAEGDPYKDELLETSRLVAEKAGVEEWSFSFQSESPTGEPWLGPDILEHLNALAARRRPPRARRAGRLRRRPPRDQVGPRRRGAGARGGARARSSTGSSCRTPSPPSFACSRGSSGVAAAVPLNA